MDERRHQNGDRRRPHPRQPEGVGKCGHQPGSTTGREIGGPRSCSRRFGMAERTMPRVGPGVLTRGQRVTEPTRTAPPPYGTSPRWPAARRSTSRARSGGRALAAGSDPPASPGRRPGGRAVGQRQRTADDLSKAVGQLEERRPATEGQVDRPRGGHGAVDSVGEDADDASQNVKSRVWPPSP